MSKPTVLITGCTEGSLGATLCREFAVNGYHVFATARDTSKAASLKQNDIEVLPLDVTSSDSIASCMSLIQEKTGGTLDIVVNNAGILTIKPVLDTSLSEGRELFEVNVWGMLAVTQAFTPMLLKSSGTILNISSTAGAVPMAWQGIYSSSKAAATCLSETLRIELEPLGVRVVTGMLGFVKTNLYANLPQVDLPKNTLYSSVEQVIADVAAGRLITENEPVEKTARNVVRDILTGKSGQIWRGGTAGAAYYCTRFMPQKTLENYVHTGRGLDKLRAASQGKY